MIKQVHILAAVRTLSLLDAALLVFRTVRIGFPSASIIVWGNALGIDASRAVGTAAKAVGAFFQNNNCLSHDAWIEGLINSLETPFWICDTDIVFFASVED